MGLYIGIIAAGLIGVVGHWLTRWTQGRTSSSFFEYINSYRARTVQSLLANVTSSFTILASTPEDIHGKALFMIIMGAYMAGYTLDSTFNKDVPQDSEIKVQRSTIKGHNKNEDINDLLASDK